MQAPGQVQRGSGEGSEGSREGLGFGAETGQVQQGSGNPEKVPGSPVAKPSQVRRRSGHVQQDPEKVWEALVHSQVRFNRVPENVPVKVWEALVLSQVRVLEKVPGEGLRALRAEPGQVQQGSGEGSGEALRKPWCKAKSGSTGFGEGCREGLGEGFGNLWCRARSGSNRFKGFPALGFAAGFRKICKNKTLRLLGIPPKLISSKHTGDCAQTLHLLLTDPDI